MEFLSSRDAVTFLSQSAPAAWVYRALLWMVQSGEIELYADKATVDAYASVMSFRGPLYEVAGGWAGDAMDEAIREHYSPEIADRLIGKDNFDEIHDEPYVVEGWDAIGALDPGFLIFNSRFDWMQGELECEALDRKILKFEWFFSSQDFVGSEFPDPSYDVSFSGLKFDAKRIELLLPSSQFSANVEKGTGVSGSRFVGRPRKWDWDGAMAHVVAMAQTPDGLPTGHGAQAKVEAMIAEWFEEQTGDSPAISQIRSKASRIMGMVEKG
jgi:hypothetical protein